MIETGLLKRLDEVEKKYLKIERYLSNPSLTPSEIHRYSKERSELGELVEIYREYKQTSKEIEENKALISDKELGALAREEITILERKLQMLNDKMQLMLLPKDPMDDKNVFLEIRAGAGGDEAALFAADLLRMYSRYAERNGWKTDILNINETGIGGIKEIILAIEGKRVYSRLKYESGVHRVQRVPTTEAGGRIHTSTATVAVLPEPDDVEVNIDTRDLKVDTFRASGPGGQHVNKTDSAIRITHIPTGIVVQCQEERSQHKNRAKAMRMLKAKLYELEEFKRQNEISSIRRNLVGSGDRSEKIRTYNFPQGRITDHRIKLTLHKIEAILDGDLEGLIDPLVNYHQSENLKQISYQ
ncbi:MAG TPA: peptide chain release factor 1 [Thermodesulfobacteriota bacterium]